jgi:AraC-like DNA-binding protein
MAISGIAELLQSVRLLVLIPSPSVAPKSSAGMCKVRAWWMTIAMLRDRLYCGSHTRLEMAAVSYRCDGVVGLTRRERTLDGKRPASFASIMFNETRRFSLDDESGRLKTEEIRLDGSGIRFSRVRSTGHRIALTESRDVTFLFPRAGALSVRIGRQRAEVAEGKAAFLRPQTRETWVRRLRAPEFEGHVLMLPLAEVRAIAAATEARPFLGVEMLPVEGTAARRLSAYVAFLLSDLDASHAPSPSAQVVAGMVALVRDLLADWLDETPHATRFQGRWTSATDGSRVRRAEEIMRSRADEALSVADLARGLGLSLRSLQLAFHNVYGEGPRARLTRIRLDLARARLLEAEPHEQVTMVALDCGFTHLSRFAEAYRQAFGERPSETLVRHRRPSARR